MAQVIPQDPTQIDPSVVALMHGMKMQEGGGQINYNAIGDQGTASGAGQWSNQPNGKPVPLTKGQIPSNFISAAKQYGLDPTDFSPDNQNKVLYAEVASGKQAGLTPEQILSAHNSGDPNKYLSSNSSGNGPVGAYNVAGYVKNAMSYAQKYAQANNQNGNTAYASGGQDTSQATPQAPVAPSVGGFLGNVASSAGNVLGGLGNAIMHPIDTVTNLASTVAGGVEKGTNALGLTNINNQDTQNFSNLVSTYGQKYGGSSIGEVVHNIGHTLYTDPVGAALDLSVVLDGAGAALGTAGKIADASKAADLAKTSDFISTTNGILKSGDPAAIKALQTPGTLTKIADAVKTAADYTNPITPVIKGAVGAAKLAGNTLLGAASNVLDLPAETITDLVKNPQDYSKTAMEANSRGGLANELGNAIDNIEQTKSTMGAEYQGIRNSGAVVTVPEQSIVDAFSKNGLNVSKDAGGKWTIAAPTADTTLSTADVSHFKSFLDQFGGEQLNANQLLNARSKLSEFSNYDGRTTASTSLARDLRRTYDDIGKTQIPNLKALDEKMSPQIQQWKGIKKEFLAKDPATGEWELKPNTASKLANAMKAGKEPLVAKLEQVMPGITRKLEVLRNIESIENRLGITSTNYLKTGGEIYGVASGNIPLAVGLILSHPTLSIPILRAFGYMTKATVLPVLSRVRALIGVLPKGAVMETAKLGTINNNVISSDGNQANY